MLGYSDFSFHNQNLIPIQGGSRTTRLVYFGDSRGIFQDSNGIQFKKRLVSLHFLFLIVVGYTGAKKGSCFKFLRASAYLMQYDLLSILTPFLLKSATKWDSGVQKRETLLQCLLEKGRHCCSVGELKITFASTCKESVFNVLFNVLFLVLDFPLGAPNTLLKHVIERSIWRIVVGEGSWWGWGFSQDWWLGFWSCWNLSLTAVFWIDFSVACFKRV